MVELASVYCSIKRSGLVELSLCFLLAMSESHASSFYGGMTEEMSNLGLRQALALAEQQGLPGAAIRRVGGVSYGTEERDSSGGRSVTVSLRLQGSGNVRRSLCGGRRRGKGCIIQDAQKQEANERRIRAGRAVIYLLPKSY